MRRSAPLALAMWAFAAGQTAAADDLIQAFQSWRLLSTQNSVTKQTDFYIAALDEGRQAIFAVECKRDIKTYFFYVEDPVLAGMTFGAKVELDFRMTNGEPDKLLGSAVGDRIVIEERMHRASFDYLLMLAYDAETGIGFSLGSRQWLFRLTGFSAAADALGKMCGYTPHSVKRPSAR